MTHTAPGDPNADGFWLDDSGHKAWLADDARRQFRFFRASLGDRPGFHVLGYDGAALPDTVQELHTTTRLVHSYSLGKLAGSAGADEVIDQGMAYLWSHHRDKDHGGFVWAMDGHPLGCT